jgi:hypothetical protein
LELRSARREKKKFNDQTVSKMKTKLTTTIRPVEKEKQVMRKLAIFAALTGLFMFALAPQVRAKDVCSVADLNGTDSFVVSGTLTAGPYAGPFAAAGTATYHGDGTTDGVIQMSLNGTQTYSNWSGTYDVDSSNCTFTKAITMGEGVLKV